MVVIERRALTAVCCVTAVLLTAAACGGTSTVVGVTGGTTGIASPSSSATTPIAPATTPASSAPMTTPPPTTKVPTTAPTTAPPTGGSTTPPCRASDVTGGWRPILGSSAAGHTSSDLAFQNTSGHKCTVSGYPRFTLYDASHHPLPTHITHGPVMALFLTVAPGNWVHAELRYSPDVPGPTEQHMGPCEPTAAYVLALLPGDTSTVKVPLTPPTSVCEMGAIDAVPFAAGPSSPVGG